MIVKTTISSMILIFSGKDDRFMCSVPLEGTSLLNRKGVEISAQQFEYIWSKNLLKLDSM